LDKMVGLDCKMEALLNGWSLEGNGGAHDVASRIHCLCLYLLVFTQFYFWIPVVN
jgi:hypothetical protein